MTKAYEPTNADLKGLLSQIYVCENGLPLECWFYWEDGEERTWEHPGCEPTFDFMYALVDGQDILPMMDDGLKVLIGATAYQAFEQRSREYDE